MATTRMRYSRWVIRHWTESIRAGEWWAFKFAPILAAFYATAFALHVSVSSLWPALLMMLAALLPGAVFVSVINDLTDLDEDRLAGKRNRLEGRSVGFAAALLVATIGSGLWISWLWRADVPLVSAYLAAWLAFSFYSVRPFRWKTRGILGVLCDASGAHFFPTIVAVLLAFRRAEMPPSAFWLAAVGCWSFAAGLRGILWHQLTDLDRDRLAGVRTFAQRHPAGARLLGTFVAFPLEIVGLAGMLLWMRSLLPVVFLLVHAGLVAMRVGWWHVRPVIVVPKEKFFIVLHEYSEALLPMSVLLASAIEHPLDLVFLATHIALFPARFAGIARDLQHASWRYTRGWK